MFCFSFYILLCFIHNFDFVAFAWKIKHVFPSLRSPSKRLSDFRRTHHDNWQNHREKFTSDQLSLLTDFLISPSYYASLLKTLLLEIPNSCSFHLAFVLDEKISIGKIMKHSGQGMNVIFCVRQGMLWLKKIQNETKRELLINMDRETFDGYSNG